MASSETASSSSEIFDCQSFFPDGNNELNMSPLDSAELPVHTNIEPEIGFWKKYSSHYEFPLSILIALGVHVIAVLVVVACMSISYYWKPPQQPIMEQEVVEARINSDKDTQDKPRHAGHTGDDASEVKTDLITVKELDVQQLPNPDKSDLNSTMPALPKNIQTATNPGRPGPKGKGGGGEKGDTIGDGVEQGYAMARNKRWRIQFSYHEPEVLLEQISNLELTVAGRLNNGRYIVYRNISSKQPLRFVEMNDTQLNSLIEQGKFLTFVNNDRVTCENFALAVHASERLLTLIMLIPPELEQAILETELKHHGKTEDAIRAGKIFTWFKVERQGSRWNIKVLKSKTEE
ncbi:MAG: hypothetical protein JNJ77_06355 [Planctomycetia bacterium]|nr:hypothetical protein [Planctomycetia bacterium]